MKTVKSVDALKGLAMTRGASASLGKSRFNSDGDKIKREKIEEKPEVKPQEPVKPPEIKLPEIHLPELSIGSLKDAMSSIDGFASEASKVNQSNAEVLQEMKKTLEQVSKREPQKWRLTVNRDTRGLLQSIDVEPK